MVESFFILFYYYLVTLVVYLLLLKRMYINIVRLNKIEIHCIYEYEY